MNHLTDLFKTEIFRKLTGRHLWKSPLLLLIPSQKKKVFLTDILMLKIDSAASSGGQEMLSFNSLRLRLRQHCQFQRSVSYLHLLMLR